jgi:hypothetical protein
MIVRRTTKALFMVSILGATPTAHAFNEVTHKIINVRAAQGSQLDQVLKTLGFAEGLANHLGGLRADEWIGSGGELEDAPFCRSARHFHDPLKPWDQAGLIPNNRLIELGCGDTHFPSSLVWAQMDPQDPTGSLQGTWSWPAARRHYFLALTSPAAVARESAWADTLRAAGHAMHFVEDASVPEHVRNDTHMHEAVLRKAGQKGYGNYEYWLADQHSTATATDAFRQFYLNRAIPPDAAVLAQPTGDPLAPVPIARLIDTNRYTGLDPNVTLGGPIGIAEFANANFFSKDTGSGLFSSQPPYPFPRKDGLVDSSYTIPTGRHVRKYWDKAPNDGIPVRPVLAECVFDQAAKAAGIPPLPVTCTDPNVWANVAHEMLPRALGYATALLDYFFRGRVAGTVEVQGAALGMRIRNLTPDERMTGTFYLYYDGPSGSRIPITSWTLALDGGGQSGFLPFPTPPRNFKGYFLVFRGTLGLESGAVAGAVVDPFPGAYMFALIREAAQPGAVVDGRTWGVIDALPSAGPAMIEGFISRTAEGPSVTDVRGTIYLYRALNDWPGIRLRLSSVPFGTGCYEAEYPSRSEPPTFLNYTGPARIEIFELETPVTRAELENYTYASPPTRVRVLTTVTATDGMAPFEVDVAGVRLIGAEMKTEPSYPSAPTRGFRINGCDGQWLVDLLP